MPLTPGSRLGPYEIVSQIGAGGMGEVYRARDTRLERTVAIKVLPERLSSSEEVRQRFEREAKTISQLSHPHICALYDVGEAPVPEGGAGRLASAAGGGEKDGSVAERSTPGAERPLLYLVMEYLEGQTLAERLVRGPLPLDQVLRYGIEIADALDKAHRSGIVHRDLKPGNVMLTKSGVKLLDFGLAKAIAPAGPSSSLTSLPTQANLTAEGTILGTFQYMAPEQLEGREADHRTDIFALGAVLYEMATGKKAFSGTSQASLISSIMSSDPQPISAVQAMSPPALDHVVQTCLAKDPEERWQSAGDIAKELKWVAGESQTRRPGADPSRLKNRERLAWAVAALAVVFGTAAMLVSRRSPPAQELVRFSFPPPSGQSFVDTVSLAPDGRRVLLLLQDYGGRTSIWVRPLDRLEARRLPGTEAARGAFWSYDGREIAFFSDGKLRRIPDEGGPSQTICESGSGFSGSWNREGTILFTADFGTKIVAVSAAGGTPRPVTVLNEAQGDVAHFYPTFLPDGRHFVFVARNRDPEKTFVTLASLDAKETRPLFRADSAAIYSGPGYLLFARDNALVAWRFDSDGLRLVGGPVPVLENVRYGTEDNRLTVSAARDRLAYLSWSPRRSLVWVDRKGRDLGTVGPVSGYEDVRISPDGGRVAAAVRDPAHGQNLDVWVLDPVQGTGSRITSERTDEFGPAWFPDGQRLAYVSDHSGFYDVYERSVTGGAEKTLIRSKQDKVLPTVSADGRHLLYGLSDGANFARVLLPLSGAGDPLRLGRGSRFSEDHPEISPDGRWTAFESSESGEREVYVEPLPEGPKRQVSIGGGATPVWRRDGGELFYRAKDEMLMSVAVRPRGEDLEIGKPQPLFSTQIVVSGIQLFRRPYDVAPDGQRFLLVRRAADTESDDAVVVMNWTAALSGAR